MSSNTQATTQTDVNHNTLVEFLNTQSADNLVKIVGKNASLIRHIKPDLLTEEIVLAALENNNAEYEWCLAFNDSEKVILKMSENSAKDSTRSLGLASERLQNDKKFVIKCICANSALFDICKFRDDEEVALEAISINASSYYSVSKRLYNTRSIILAAFMQDNNILKNMNAILLNDKAFIIELIELDEGCIAYLPSSSIKLLTVKDDLKLVLGLSDKPQLLKYLPNFTSSKEVAEKFVADVSSVLKYFDASIKDDKPLALKFVARNKLTFTRPG